MKAEDYGKLTKNEKRFKVAEICGFTEIRYRDASDHPWIHSGWVGILNGIEGLVPDYLNDLNACHEFEMAIHNRYLEALNKREPYEKIQCAEDGINRYREYLSETFGEMEGDIDWEWLMVIATAEQRCKAFVLTMTEEELLCNLKRLRHIRF